MIRGERARLFKPGEVVFTHLLGNVTLVRETTQSGVIGWEVTRSDGKTAYLFYEDFDLTELEVDEIRNALATMHRTPHAVPKGESDG